MFDPIGDILQEIVSIGPREKLEDVLPYTEVSTLEPACERKEIHTYWPEGVPRELERLWLTARSARLFEDATYGQWGLHILSPEQAKAATIREQEMRPESFLDGDVVFGEFFGDLDVLVLAAPASSGEGPVLVAYELYERADWEIAAPTLHRFLELYREHSGKKYWEMSEFEGDPPGSVVG